MSVYFLKKTASDTDKVTTQSNFPLLGMIIVYVGDLIVTGTDDTVQDFYTEFEVTCSISPPEELVVDGPSVTFLGFEYSRKKIISKFVLQNLPIRF